MLYGDTDSLFIASAAPDTAAARREGQALAAQLSAALAQDLAARYGVRSHLTLRLSEVYLRLHLPRARSRGGSAEAGGARKRYAGLVEVDGQPRVQITGMEAVRTDWTPLSRTVQRELYQRLFTDQPVEAYLRGTIAALRAGQLDDLLLYRKRLSKSADAYQGALQPHVAAARSVALQPGMQAPRVVSYLMTRAGPQPEGALRSPIDYEHYLQHQLRPIAEPVLALLGLDFGALSGEGQQLSLWGPPREEA